MANDRAPARDRREAVRSAATVSLAAVAAFLASGRGGRAQGTGEAPLSVDDMIGKVLRVYHSGDPVTLDFREDRMNVELGADDRIVRISVG